MQSASFRVLSTIIWLLLLVLLALVVVLVVRDNPPGAESRIESSPSTALRQTSAPTRQEQANEEPVAIRPTFTSTPYVIQASSVPLLNTKRILAGGYSFKPIEGYQLEISDGSVTMTAPDADKDVGPTMLLIGGADSPLIRANTRTTEEAFDQFVDSFAKDGNFAIGARGTVSTQRLNGVAADLSNPKNVSSSANAFAGRIFVARPNPPQFFVLVGIAPPDAWENGVAQQFDAVLDSVSLFRLTNQFASSAQPTATAAPGSRSDVDPASNSAQSPQPTAQSEARILNSAESNVDATRSSPVANTTVASGRSQTQNSTTALTTQNEVDSANSSAWRTFTNGNFVNEAIIVNDLVWAATDGGVVAWNLNSGSASKFTTADGLLANQTNAVALCEFTDLGIVFGTSAGLQIFNLGDGRWSTLNSENSLMSFDNVSDLYCDSTYGFMVIGYQRHGIDIFDANKDEWLHFDRNRALVSNVVRQLTVVGDRQELWIVSDLGLTVLENIPEPNNRRSSFFNHDNSPLRELPIDAMAKAADGSVWLAQENKVYRVREVTQSQAGSTQREWTDFTLDGVEGEFPRGPIRSLAAASNQATDQTIWIGAQSRDLCRFDPDVSSCIEFYDDSDRSGTDATAASLTTLVADVKGGGDSLFYATEGEGLIHFDGTDWSNLVLEDELLTSNTIRHLAQDADGTIWVATSAEIHLMEKRRGSASTPSSAHIVESSAAQRIRQGNRSLFDSVQRGEAVTGLWADHNGAIWLGTDGADHVKGTNWKSYSSLNGLVGSPVQAFTVDNLNRSWIGTANGLNVLNEETFFSLTTDQGLPDDNVQAIIADLESPENVVWIGTAEGGLLRFEKNQLAVFNVENANLPSNTVTTLALDADGSLLVGTDNGLARLMDGRATKIRALGDAAVTSIVSGASRLDETTTVLWVGTEESGLFHYNGLAWEQLSTWNLPDQHITTLLVDDDGTLWIGSANGGLVLHDPTE